MPSSGSAAPPGELRMSLRAEALEVRETLLRLLTSLEPARLSADDRSNLELILAELLNNIVEHAYEGAPGRIDLCIVPAPASLLCEVWDTGRPMPGGALPMGAIAVEPALMPDLPEGGFGWFLIRTLTRGLTYSREAGVNRVTFEMDLVPDPQMA